MAQIEGKKRIGHKLCDAFLMIAILSVATVFCALLRSIDKGDGYVSLLFVLAVACISRWTEGYFFGIFASFCAVIFVNYIFTYPYWEFNFTMTGYPLTFLTMLTVSIMISTMNTLIKKQERLRRETEKEAMRANLLRAMSHDIRTPLTSIVGNTTALLENGEAFSKQQERKLLQDMKEDAQWLIRMVENLLSITRISGEETGITKEPELAEEVIESSVIKFAKRFPEIHVSVAVPEEVLLVPMDVTLVQQVLLNLMENAVIHGKSVTEIHLGVCKKSDYAEFSVCDNGCGILKEKLNSVFDGGLSEVSQHNFDMKKNMGIGLSVCRTIVKAHGGSIQASNLPAGGASFTFRLPLKEETNETEG